MSLHRNKSPLIKKGWVRALVFLLCYLVLNIAAGKLLAEYLNNKEAIITQKYPSSVWIMISFAISAALVFVFRKYIDKRTFTSIGFEKNNMFRETLLGLLLGLFILSTGSLIVFLLNGLRWIDIQADQQYIVFSILLLLMVAVGEEIVFRGYILRNLMKSVKSWIALPASACIFMIVHATNVGLSPVGLVNIFLGGLLLGITYMFTRNLWMAVAFHFAWNFLQGPVFGFPVSGMVFGSLFLTEFDGNDWLTGGKFGFEGSLVCTFLLLPVCIIAWWLYYRNQNTYND